MYSSMSKGSRKPPGRLRILEKVSKSTVGGQRMCSGGVFVRMGWMEGGGGKDGSK